MKLKEGDYVVATKYSDGDPTDHFCIGFFKGLTEHNPPRYDIVDGNGNLFRGNGFRRVRKIREDFGNKLVANIKVIETSYPRSVWSWVRQFERS